MKRLSLHLALAAATALFSFTSMAGAASSSNCGNCYTKFNQCLASSTDTDTCIIRYYRCRDAYGCGGEP